MTPLHSRITLPRFTNPSLIAATGYSFGLKARIEAPAGTVDGTQATLNSTWSGTLNVTIDPVAPISPVFNRVDDRASIVIDGFESYYSKTSRPQLTGTAEAGSIIKVVANNVVLGTTTVLPNGTWSFDQLL